MSGTPSCRETGALTLRTFEIATWYLDLVAGRKVSRDLGARRSAQVHRTGESQ